MKAANEDLAHIGDVAKAIADAGGLELTEECRYHVKIEGKLLPCRCGRAAVPCDRPS